MSEYYEKSIIVTESGEYEVKKVQSNHRGVLGCWGVGLSNVSWNCR